MSDWRPIETAPKDGTTILVADAFQMAVVWWGDINAADSEYGTVDHEANWGWLFTDGHNDPMWYRSGYRMTHWMPLPAPPSDHQ